MSPPVPHLKPAVFVGMSAYQQSQNRFLPAPQESKTAEDSLHVVEGMQFDRGYISPYFVTDPERMVRRRLKGMAVPPHHVAALGS